MLRVELIGNLGAAAEQRFTQQGRTLTQLRVAVNQRQQRPDGESEETTTWSGVRAMGTLGERCTTLDKGARVLAIGSDAWTSARTSGRTGRQPWPMTCGPTKCST